MPESRQESRLPGTRPAGLSSLSPNTKTREHWPKRPAARIPYGEELSVTRLKRIDAAESYLRSLAPFKQIRVRDHGRLARLELDREGIGYLLDEGVSQKVVKRLKELGYDFVTMDLEGYRFGSFDK